MKLYTLDDGTVINLDHISFISNICPSANMYYFQIQMYGSPYFAKHVTNAQAVMERDALILAWKQEDQLISANSFAAV